MNATTQLRRPVHDTSHRTFSSMFFAPVGDGVRHRQGKDVGRVIVAMLGLLVLGLLLTSREKFQADITKALHPPALGLSWVFTWLWIICSFGTIVLIVTMALMGRRLVVLRDSAVAAGIALSVAIGFQYLFGVAAGFPADKASALHGVNLGFPVPRLAIVAAITIAALPYFSRGIQRLLELVIVLAVISGVVHGAGLPFSLLGSIVVGWGAAAATRLIFGSTTGLPSASEVRSLISSLGLSVDNVITSRHQDWGLARYVATDETGSRLQVSLYGRDAQQSQLFAKLYRAAFYRNDPTPFSFTRTQQVDHECYMTMLAADAAPGQTSVIIGSGMVGPDRDGLVVARVPAGTSLAEIKTTQAEVSDDALKSICSALKSFQEKGLAHQAIDPSRLYIDGDLGGIADFERSQNFGDTDAFSRDVAALVTSMAIATDAQRSVDAALAIFGPELVTSALGFLQGAALPASLASELRKEHNKGLLKELRKVGADSVDVEEPKLTEIKRMSWTTLILTVGTLIGAWALIGVFLHVAASFSTIMSANPVWVLITAIVSQIAYFGSALSTMGSVMTPLPYFPLTALELSNTFSGLALGTPAVLAARIRFFQKHGVDTSLAVSSGVLVSTASWIVKGGLFLVCLPFALGSMHLHDLTGSSSSSGGSGTRYLEYGIILVVAIGILVAVFLAVPRWRGLVKAKLVPRLREVFDHFKMLIHQPAKMAEIFGGMFIAQLVIAFALGASVHAFGYRLSLPVLIVVLTIGSMLGGVSPVPGGMGVVEAGMILGLKAAGLPSDVAVSAVFVQRLFTAYLPPIAGWFALMWLRRKEYL